MIVDAKPKDVGLPTDAYIGIEEVHDVSSCVIQTSSVTNSLSIYYFWTGSSLKYDKYQKVPQRRLTV